jgi:hypothetical protein
VATLFELIHYQCAQQQAASRFFVTFGRFIATTLDVAFAGVAASAIYRSVVGLTRRATESPPPVLPDESSSPRKNKSLSEREKL